MQSDSRKIFKDFRTLFCISMILLLNLTLIGETNCDTVSFSSSGSALRGYFYSAEVPAAPTLVFTQGFMETGDIWNIGKALSENGINVFTFDFRGCHESEGKQGLMNSLEDIRAAIMFLQSSTISDKYGIDTGNIILGGYSYGGHMSMLYAVYHPEIKRIISISGGDLGIVAKQLETNPDLRSGYSGFFQSLKKPHGPVDFLFDDPIDELMQNQDNFNIMDQANKLANVDILLIGGADDRVVSMENYILPIYRKLKQNEGQSLTLKIYQDGHGYNSYCNELIADITSWIITQKFDKKN